MSPISVLHVISLYYFVIVFPQNSESFEKCPYFNEKPPPGAQSPINIITKNAKPLNVSTGPLHLKSGLFGPLKIMNTGVAFEIYGNPEVVSGGVVTGGVLCNETYIFHKLRAWISQDPNGRSYNEIDGEGSPLTITIYYFNGRYLTFDKARNYPGGIVGIHYMITYSKVINPFFTLDNIAIRLFRYPGTFLYFAPEILLYAWFNNLPAKITHYYAFWGSYLDLFSGKEYMNSIEIQTDGIFKQITKSQMAAFRSLLNIHLKKLETVAPLKKQVQPVVKVKGFIETSRLF